MRIFGTDSTNKLQGCFVRFDLNLEKSQGAVLSVPSGDNNTILPTLTANSDYLPFVITNVNFVKRENMSHQKCFKERVYTYTFGEDIGQLSITFAAFLTTGVINQGNDNILGTGGQQGDVVKDMLDVYDKGRISVSKRRAILRLGASGEVLKGQLAQLGSSTQNLEANIQTFQLTMHIVPDPPKKKNNK